MRRISFLPQMQILEVPQFAAAEVLPAQAHILPIAAEDDLLALDRKSTRLNSSHM